MPEIQTISDLEECFGSLEALALTLAGYLEEHADVPTYAIRHARTMADMAYEGEMSARKIRQAESATLVTPRSEASERLAIGSVAALSHVRDGLSEVHAMIVAARGMAEKAGAEEVDRVLGVTMVMVGKAYASLKVVLNAASSAPAK